MDPASDFLNMNISTVLDKNFEQFNQFLIFVKSIEWTEPWLMGLVAFHVLMTLFTLLTRKRPAFQAILFLTLLILVYMSEDLNKLAAENWRLYSKQQYFDSEGMFISLVFSAPLLFNCMLMVFNWLLISSELMTSLRRFQLQQISKKKQNNHSGNSEKKDSKSSVPPTTMTLRSRNKARAD